MPLIVVVVVIVLVYAFLVGSRRGGRMGRFQDCDYAHRGMYDNLRDMPENSLLAFERACTHKLGIELDVRLSKDGTLVVFHDDTLERACGDGRNVKDLTLCELQSLPLFGSDVRIPTFAEALERIDGRVPLIVEIKHEERYRESVQKTVEALRWYKGLYCIESFNPFALRELRRIAPEIPRGQLAAGLADSARDVGPLIGFALANLLTNCLSRPDFVAYDVNHMGAWQIWVQRRFFRTPIALWTIRTEEQAMETTGKGYIRICEWFENDECA